MVQRPKSAVAILRKTLQMRRWDRRAKRYQALVKWREIVGEELAAAAAPEKITRRGILMVRVIDAAWAQELTLRQSEILKKIEEVEGAPVVTGIKCIAAGPKFLKR